MRATSKRLCFMASMALSNRTLSGCLVSTLASGFFAFLLVQAAVRSNKPHNIAIYEFRRNIRTSSEDCKFQRLKALLRFDIVRIAETMPRYEPNQGLNF